MAASCNFVENPEDFQIQVSAALMQLGNSLMIFEMRLLFPYDGLEQSAEGLRKSQVNALIATLNEKHCYLPRYCQNVLKLLGCRSKMFGIV